MSVSLNAAPAPAADSRDWSALAPTVQELPSEDLLDFFSTAPQGTVVEVYGELFLRGYSTVWLGLESLRDGDGFYEGPSNSESSPGDLVAWAAYSTAPVRVLRLGPGQS